jgi:membrane protein
MTRGRDAVSPLEMPMSGWLDIVARAIARISSERLALLAAGVAFYGLLSFFPAVTAGFALLGVFIDPATVVERSTWLINMLPDAAGDILMGQLSDVASASEGALGLAAILAIGIALWSASNAVGSLMQGLNIIYEEREDRGFIGTKLLTIGLTIMMIFGLSLSVIIVAAIPAALSIFGASDASAWAQLLRWPIMLAIGIAGIATLYRFAPDRRAARWRWLTPGAVVSCTLWVLGTVGFSYYVQSFGTYNETFGALAGVIVLLTWMWLSAFVVFLGALLDAEIEAQTRHDSTIGPERPMGERGAYKADNLGDARSGNGSGEEPEPAE